MDHPLPTAPAIDPATSAAEAIDPLFLEVPEVARALRLSRSTVYTLLESGALESVKVGRRRLIPTAAARAYAAALRGGAA